MTNEEFIKQYNEEIRKQMEERMAQLEAQLKAEFQAEKVGLQAENAELKADNLKIRLERDEFKAQAQDAKMLRFQLNETNLKVDAMAEVIKDLQAANHSVIKDAIKKVVDFSKSVIDRIGAEVSAEVSFLKETASLSSSLNDRHTQAWKDYRLISKQLLEDYKQGEFKNFTEFSEKIQQLAIDTTNSIGMGADKLMAAIKSDNANVEKAYAEYAKTRTNAMVTYSQNSHILKVKFDMASLALQAKLHDGLASAKDTFHKAVTAVKDTVVNSKVVNKLLDTIEAGKNKSIELANSAREKASALKETLTQTPKKLIDHLKFRYAAHKAAKQEIKDIKDKAKAEAKENWKKLFDKTEEELDKEPTEEEVKSAEEFIKESDIEMSNLCQNLDNAKIVVNNLDIAQECVKSLDVIVNDKPKSLPEIEKQIKTQVIDKLNPSAGKDKPLEVIDKDAITYLANNIANLEVASAMKMNTTAFKYIVMKTEQNMIKAVAEARGLDPEKALSSSGEAIKRQIFKDYNINEAIKEAFEIRGMEVKPDKQIKGVDR